MSQRNRATLHIIRKLRYVETILTPAPEPFLLDTYLFARRLELRDFCVVMHVSLQPPLLPLLWLNSLICADVPLLTHYRHCEPQSGFWDTSPGEMSNQRHQWWMIRFVELWLCDFLHNYVHIYRVNTKKCSPPATFVDISVMSANFCMKIYVNVKQSNTHFVTKFGWNISKNDKITLFQPRQPAFLSVRASCRTDWMRTDSLRRLSGPQALQIWTHWTVTSGAPC